MFSSDVATQSEDSLVRRNVFKIFREYLVSVSEYTAYQCLHYYVAICNKDTFSHGIFHQNSFIVQFLINNGQDFQLLIYVDLSELRAF